MIRLHLVGFTPDLKGLVFSGRRGGRTGTYWVPVNDAFWRALEQLETARREAAGTAPKKKSAKNTAAPAADATPAKPGVAEVLELLPRRQLRALREVASPAGRPQSKLTPKDIQQMLREGRTVKDVAAQAGVEEAWVERFKGPVDHEIAGVIQMTRDGYQSRPRLGRSGLPVGPSVERNLIDRKATSQTLAELDGGWEARRTNTRAWRVRLRFTHRGKRRVAEWELIREDGTIRPRNQMARELGWWAPDLQAAAEPDAQAPAPETVTAIEAAPAESPPVRTRTTRRARSAAKTPAKSRGRAASGRTRKAASAPKRVGKASTSRKSAGGTRSAGTTRKSAAKSPSRKGGSKSAKGGAKTGRSTGARSKTSKTSKKAPAKKTR